MLIGTFEFEDKMHKLKLRIYYLVSTLRIDYRFSVSFIPMYECIFK